MATGIMFFTHILTLVTIGALSVRVSTTTGETFEGDWRGVSGAAVVVDVDGENREFAFDRKQSIKLELANGCRKRTWDR